MIDLDGFSFDEEAADSAGMQIREQSLQDIAVIGMSACLPGAPHIRQFWKSLADGDDQVMAFPENRKADIRGYAGRLGVDLDRTGFFKGAYLPEIDKFDYPFFRLSPREASLMNPNQRLFLETAWKALEDAGYGGDQLKGSKTGVFLGYCADALHDYKRLIESQDPSGMSIAVTGNLSSVIASRIAYLLDLRGPAITIDTACSSSLVAVHLACQALRTGDCDTALVGSVKTLLFPADTGMRIGIESSDGRAKPFDHRSDGTGMGEGAGAVLLKPLVRALADGDAVYAVIKGSAVNQDGSSIGISAPNVAAQEEVIVQAWENAGIDPVTIAYIEAHGTGTKLGDPIEIEGINRAFRKYTDLRQFCAVGSVKSNLGHLDNAAGIVGFMKACLALQHKQMPPSLHFNRPNASIDFIESAVYVNTQLSEWERESEPRRCGVSSFGLSGTNCHLILEEAPEEADYTEAAEEPSDKEHLFTLSAKSKASLARLMADYADFLSDEGKRLRLCDICFTANVGRNHFDCRVALVVNSVEELADRIGKARNLSPEALADAGIRSSFEAADPQPAIPGLAADSLHEWCRRYVSGAEVPWKALYRDGSYRRVHLPSYSFDGHRCWVDEGSIEERVALLPLSEGQDREAGQVNLLGRTDQAYSPMELAVAGVWAEVLGFSDLDIRDHFYTIGGDSILAFQIAVKLSERLSRQIEAADVLKHETIERLAAHLEQTASEPETTDAAAVSDTRFALTSSQLRIYVQEQTGAIGTSYNMPLAFRVRGASDPISLERALGCLVQRHEALRTSFGMEEGVPVQSVHASVEFKLERFEAKEGTLDAVLAQFVRPFELDRAPLFRAGLADCGEHGQVLLIDTHHLVSDGFSTAILIKEFFELYKGAELPPAVPYRSFAMWREQFAESAAMARQEDFWRSELSDLGSPLSLPLDRPRPPVKTFAGKNIGFRIPVQTHYRLKQFAASSQTTPNILLLSLYGLTILQCAGQREAVIGSIVSGRQKTGFEGCVGMFINFIPIRMRADTALTIHDFIEAAKQRATACYENQDVPFERMAEFVKGPLDRSRNSIYDTMLVYHNEYRMALTDRFSVDGLTFEPIEFPVHTATLDVKLDIFLGDSGELDCKLNYNADLFDEQTMLRLIESFLQTIEHCLDKPQLPLAELPFWSKKETTSPILINATFTAEPVEAELRRWVKLFDLPVEIRFGAYNQIYQALLGGGDQHEPNAVARIMLLRFEDLLGQAYPNDQEAMIELERHFQDLLRIVQSMRKSVPYLFGIFPTAAHLGYSVELTGFMNQLYERWAQALQGIEHVHAIDFRETFRAYGVPSVFDSIADRAGHMPFSEEAYAAMGASIARKMVALYAAPFKVIVLDCDNTLWHGVCGEDGPLGVRIGASHSLLQSWLLARAEEGLLLALCSKNNEADVWAVFENHPDMRLKKEHIAHAEVNWLPKSENLKRIAKELNLGLDSMAFIDDNPLECSEVMRNAPDVLTLRLPADTRHWSVFLEHLWAFDRLKITEEDRMRTRLYAEERSRRIEFESSALSLEQFLSGLGLKMSMRTVAAGAGELSRASQLTHRTNQFNLNGIRRTEEQLNAYCRSNRADCWIVEVSDRFGDYGIVGVVTSERAHDQMVVDTFLLSCRVLGRNIEDAMMSLLKQTAAMHGCKELVLKFRRTEKNKPLASFLESRGWTTVEEAADGGKCRLIPLAQIGDCPTHVEAYFESAYEKQSRIAKTARLQSAPTHEVVVVGAEEDGASFDWDPEIHWMPEREIPGSLRHSAYLSAISYSRSNRLLRSLIETSQSVPAARQPFAAPATPTECRLAALWSELLRVDSPGRHDHFFEIGGNSLKAASLVSKIHQAFGTELEIGDIFAHPSLMDMAERITETASGGFEAIAPCEEKPYYPVLSAQKRLFLLHELHADRDGYNMPGVLKLEGVADIQRINEALQALVQRHEALRTSFGWEDGEIVQRIHPDAELMLEVIEVPDDRMEERIRGFVRPFRLSEPPLVREALLRASSGKQFVLFDMHHIISDGISLGNLLHDFARAYSGASLPRLRLQPKDFAEWQRSRLASGALEEQKEYWLQSFARPVGKLKLPADGEPVLHVNDGGIHTFRADSQLVRKLTDCAAEQGATLFMLLLAGYYVLLSKCTGQTDIVVGTPVAGRTRTELEEMIGMFVNTLALRSFPEETKPFDAYLLEVRELTLQALKHQEYPFESLVQDLNVSIEPGRNPLFDTLFAMQNMEPFRYEFDGAVLTPYPTDFGVSRFDLTLQASVQGEELEFTFEYRRALFHRDAIGQLSDRYIRVLEQIAERPSILLREIRVLGEEERNQIAVQLRAQQRDAFAEFDF